MGQLGCAKDCGNDVPKAVEAALMTLEQAACGLQTSSACAENWRTFGDEQTGDRAKSGLVIEGDTTSRPRGAAILVRTG